MSLEANKALARRFFAEADTKSFEAAGEIVAPNFVAYLPGMPGPLDFAAFEQFVMAFNAGFPDYIHTIEDQVAAGDRVATRITWRGTHTGAFQGLPATGKAVSMSGINIVRIANGKIAETWSQFDALGLMQQLGAIPTPEPVAG